MECRNCGCSVLKRKDGKIVHQHTVWSKNLGDRCDGDMGYYNKVCGCRNPEIKPVTNSSDESKETKT